MGCKYKLHGSKMCFFCFFGCCIVFFGFLLVLIGFSLFLLVFCGFALVSHLKIVVRGGRGAEALSRSTCLDCARALLTSRLHIPFGSRPRVPKTIKNQ